MSVMVRIPTPLRRMTNGKDKVEVESDNLNDKQKSFLNSFKRKNANQKSIIDQNSHKPIPYSYYLDNPPDIKNLS